MDPVHRGKCVGNKDESRFHVSGNGSRPESFERQVSRGFVDAKFGRVGQFVFRGRGRNRNGSAGCGRVCPDRHPRHLRGERDSKRRATDLRALPAGTRRGSDEPAGFRHPGKAEAIDLIWRERHRLHRDYLGSNDKVAFLSTLPWIGPVTRGRLAWNLGLLKSPSELESQAVA